MSPMSSSRPLLRFILLVLFGGILPWFLITSWDLQWGPSALSIRSLRSKAPRPIFAPFPVAVHVPTSPSLQPTPSSSTEEDRVACTKLEGLPVARISPEQISRCDQHSPLLWAYIKHHHITLPSPSWLPYTFGPQRQNELLKKVWPILRKQTRGKKKKIFIEAGASDGISDSNSIWLEQQLGWTGILIECHPEVLPSLRQRNRRAYIADVCLSTTSYASRSNLTSVDGWSFASSFGNGSAGVTVFPDFAKSFTNYEVQMMPLYGILAALDVWDVDFFSLDIQSLEPAVLATFPFDLVNVTTWVIEVELLSLEERRAFIGFMRAKGYFVSDTLGDGGSNIVFIKYGR